MLKRDMVEGREYVIELRGWGDVVATFAGYYDDRRAKNSRRLPMYRFTCRAMGADLKLASLRCVRETTYGKPKPRRGTKGKR